MKKDRWEKLGGGGTRNIQFTKGAGDFPILKPSGKTLNISIGEGLPPDSSNFSLIFFHYGLTHIFDSA